MRKRFCIKSVSSAVSGRVGHRYMRPPFQMCMRETPGKKHVICHFPWDLVSFVYLGTKCLVLLSKDLVLDLSKAI